MKIPIDRFPIDKYKSRITAADLPPNLPKTAKWLSGHGQGIWFDISKPKHLAKNEFRVKRIALTGDIDCDRVFIANASSKINLSENYDIGHISHCQKCVIIQNYKKHELFMVREYSEVHL